MSDFDWRWDDVYLYVFSKFVWRIFFIKLLRYHVAWGEVTYESLVRINLAILVLHSWIIELVIHLLFLASQGIESSASGQIWVLFGSYVSRSESNYKILSHFLKRVFKGITVLQLI
jgi:hypothetical protein